GVSFFGIKDLSKPDALLAGINILPILMTFFNILATLTTKKFTKRERVQAFVIAALFLVMLYNAPSALLIYWTTNNFIMLLKNINLSGIISGEKISGFMNYKFVPTGKKAIFINAFMMLLTWGFLGSFFAYFYFSFVNTGYANLATITTYQNIYYLLFMIPVIFAWMLYTKFIASGFTIREFLIKTVYFAVGTLTIFIFMKYIMFPQKSFIRLFVFTSMLFIYVLLMSLLVVKGVDLCSFASRLSGGHRSSLFFSSVIFIIIFICVFYPSLLYFTDPNFFLDSFAGTISGVSAYGMTLLFALILIWPLIPELLQNIFAFAAAFLVCIAFINSFVLTENYGNINVTFINNMMMMTERALIRDILSFLITSVIIILCVWRKYIKHLVSAFLLISLAMCGASVYCYLNIAHDNKAKLAENIIEFPEYHNRIWRFSRTGKNVICLFFDGFTGGHINKIFTENPELVKSFDGFIYFPDTISTGSYTFPSAPSIYAGPAYNPYKLDTTRPNEKLVVKYGEAVSFLPNIFSGKGYDSVMIDAPYGMDYKNFYTNNLKYPDRVLTLYEGSNWEKNYSSYWLKWADNRDIHVLTKEKSDISGFLIILSLFRSIPFSLRNALHNSGRWVWGISDQVAEMAILNNFLPNIAILQFMGDFLQVDDGDPAFKFIHNNLSHSDWYLQPDSLQPVLDPYPESEGQNTLIDGIIPEHYYTEVHIMNFMANFIASLKAAGIYDNTRIVFVSDHGWGDSQKLNEIFNNKIYTGSFRPHALLMFKDFDTRGDFKTSDNALMSIEDTSALLIAGIDKAAGINTLEELKTLSHSDRVRIFSDNATNNDEIINRYLFKFEKIYQVKGTMFKRENWTRIK
ncbi:MAG: sulfatase-like hydrolase/transferase, partial [Synergistaceae bacterium]|nr:sulfatase-like hydrolase/transferase [Synergistaceae bacterium]